MGDLCKRAHKHSYNAKSGVGTVIGLETGKSLYMGVCNKYCSTCTQANKENTMPQEHDCYKIGMALLHKWRHIRIQRSREQVLLSDGDI